MTVNRTSCLYGPPPQRPAFKVSGPEDGCPRSFTACLDFDSTGKLIGYLERLEDYAEEAWLRCRENPSLDAGLVPDGSSGASYDDAGAS